MRSIGYVPVEGWASCFHNEKSDSFACIYVVGFLVVAPKGGIEACWKAIGDRVEMGTQGPLTHFLGCTHHVVASPTPEEPSRIEVQFDMCGYVQDSVKSYLEQTGISGPLRGAQTPFLGDEETETEVPGKHSAVARSVLAKLLYCSRLARPDLMLSINLLSRNLTTWSEYHDRALARLMS